VSVGLLAVHPVHGWRPAGATEREVVTAIGDSGLDDESGRLLQALLSNGQDAVIDAVRGRTASNAPAVVRRYRKRHQLGTTVVVQLGNDAPVAERDADRLFAQLRGVRRLVVVNVATESRWKARVNETLAARTSRLPNARLIDWNVYAQAHPGVVDWDGTLEPDGSTALSTLIASAAR
jgi:hypothetical protein